MIEISKADFATLKDIDLLPRVSEQDRRILAQLERVLVRHNQQHRIGVVLLHKHFDVGPDEVAVDRHNVDKRLSVISVEKDGSTPNLIPSMMRFRRKE